MPMVSGLIFGGLYSFLVVCQVGGKESDLVAPVSIELDATMVSGLEAEVDHFKIKSSIKYSQVVQMVEKRRRLMDKVAYGSVSDSETFGENFYAFCRDNGLDLRRRVLLLSYGADGLTVWRRTYLWRQREGWI
ncbi:MAG TPA: hypothetical protein PKV46_06375 [Candidatus Marinimicrobia bacterium]|nr:hypothetical protein [Candidatus Neomarinimicrobiota bacterium]